MIYRNPGQTITLSTTFIDDGVFFDPATVDNIEIYDPASALVTTVVPVHASTGHYTAVYTVPAAATGGTWTHRWKWTANLGEPELSQDYHFAVIEAAVPTQNLSKVSETVGIYDPVKKEILWSICTGVNTVPDKNVNYSTIFKGFWFDDQPASIWAYDNISATTQKIIGAGGLNHLDDVYWRDSDSADFATGNIDANWRSADWNLGSPNGMKQLINIYISARAQTEGQLLTVSWYLDGSATAKGSTVLTLTTDWVEYQVPLSGLCRLISLEFTQSDRGGKVEAIPDTIEFMEMTSFRRTVG